MLPDKFPRRRHLFVCVNQRSSGKPACGAAGSAAIAHAVQTGLIALGDTRALVTECGCLGPCFDGPNAVVYGDEEAVWYGRLEADDAAGLVEHLRTGAVLAPRVTGAPGE